jgi:hypothetical protein
VHAQAGVVTILRMRTRQVSESPFLTDRVRAHFTREVEVVVDGTDDFFHEPGCALLTQDASTTVRASLLDLFDHDTWWKCWSCLPLGAQADHAFLHAFWLAAAPCDLGLVTPEFLERAMEDLRATAGRFTGVDLSDVVLDVEAALRTAASETSVLVATHGSAILDLAASVATCPDSAEHFKRSVEAALLVHRKSYVNDLGSISALPPFRDSGEQLRELLDHHEHRPRPAGHALVILPVTATIPPLVRLVLERAQVSGAPGSFMVPADFAQVFASGAEEYAPGARRVTLQDSDLTSVVETAARLALDGLDLPVALEAARAL